MPIARLAAPRLAAFWSLRVAPRPAAWLGRWRDPASLVPLALVVLALSLVAAACRPEAYALHLVRYTETFALLARAFGGVLVAGLIGVSLIIHRAPARTLTLVRDALLRASPVMLGLVLLMASYTSFKTAIPTLTPFWADAPLAALDARLHGGDPYLWLHRAVPDAVARAGAYAYGLPWFALWFVTPVVVAACPPGAWRTRYLLALALTVVLLGNVAATVLASVGPVFYDAVHGGDRFAGLAAAYAAPGASAALSGMPTASGYLLDAYHAGADGLGTGISAMPSVHCAVAFLNAFFLTSVRRWLAVPAWTFAGLIAMFSVYSGWHYALDGYVSLVGVAVIWFLTGRALGVGSYSAA